MTFRVVTERERLEVGKEGRNVDAAGNSAVHKFEKRFEGTYTADEAKAQEMLVNGKGVDTSLFGHVEAIGMAIEQEEEAMGETGRVLVRPSGTEPVVRVMVECTEPGVAEATAARLHALIEHELLAAAATREAEAQAAADALAIELDAGI